MIKINLLYMSLKILYSNIKDDIYNQIELQNNLNLINKNNSYNNINEIKFIFIAHKLSQSIIVQKIAHSIIKVNNNKNKQSICNYKYLNKFKYLYYNSLNYYKYNSLSLDYGCIAILNLYIIINCYKSKNIFFLIKYLYTPF